MYIYITCSTLDKDNEDSSSTEEDEPPIQILDIEFALNAAFGKNESSGRLDPGQHGSENLSLIVYISISFPDHEQMKAQVRAPFQMRRRDLVRAKIRVMVRISA